MEFAKELNDYYLLSQAIEELENRIKHLEAQLYVSPRFDKVGTSESSGKNTTEKKYIHLAGLAGSVVLLCRKKNKDRSLH